MSGTAALIYGPVQGPVQSPVSRFCSVPIVHVAHCNIFFTQQCSVTCHYPIATCIISESSARALWSTESPIQTFEGKCCIFFEGDKGEEGEACGELGVLACMTEYSGSSDDGNS